MTKIVLLIIIGAAVVGIILYAIKSLLDPLFEYNSCVKLTCQNTNLSKKEVKKRIRGFVDEVKNRCKSELGLSIKILPIYQISKHKELGFGTAVKMLRIVTYSPIWIEKILTSQKLWKLSFVQSVGHEIGHRRDLSRGVFFLVKNLNDRKFFLWVREVRCDYFGLEFASQVCPLCSRGEILEAIQVKADEYAAQSLGKKNKNYTHPSWKIRLKILRTYENFNEDVIRFIAKEAGCINAEYISKIVSLLK